MCMCRGGGGGMNEHASTNKTHIPAHIEICGTAEFIS